MSAFRRPAWNTLGSARSARTASSSFRYLSTAAFSSSPCHSCSFVRSLEEVLQGDLLHRGLGRLAGPLEHLLPGQLPLGPLPGEHAERGVRLALVGQPLAGGLRGGDGGGGGHGALLAG